MKRIIGASIGLLLGSTAGWLAFGSIPGAIGLALAVAATLFGLLSRLKLQGNPPGEPLI